MSSDLPDGFLDSDGDREGGGSTESDTDEQSFERFTIVSIGDHRLAIPVADVDTVINRRIETTRVPRAPEAVDGVTDIRGQITTIVDPHVHFPDSGGSSATPSLLVFADREQPAATWVEEVEGVEAVPEDGVVDQAAYDPEEIAGTALEHPLLVGAIRVERRQRGAIVESVGPRDGETVDREGAPDPLDQSLERSETDDEEVVVGEFSLDEESDGTEAPSRSRSTMSEETDVEVTPILDVDRFLLAAGRVARERDPVTDTTADREAVESDSTGGESGNSESARQEAVGDAADEASDEESTAETAANPFEDSPNDFESPADDDPGSRTDETEASDGREHTAGTGTRGTGTGSSDGGEPGTDSPAVDEDGSDGREPADRVGFHAETAADATAPAGDVDDLESPDADGDPDSDGDGSA